MATDEYYMSLALEEAQRAVEIGEVPVGAVVVKDDMVIASAHNTRESESCPYGHAEFLALMQASEHLDQWRLSGCTVYVTLEPCLMCAGLMTNARIDRCVYGASDLKAGALGSLYTVHSDERLNHAFDVVSGVMEEEAAKVLKDFFRGRRALNKQLKHLNRDQKQNLKIDELGALRTQITTLDNVIHRALQKRYEVSKQVALYKEKHDLPILDSTREQEILKSIKVEFDDVCATYIAEVQQLVMAQSRAIQQEVFTTREV